MPLPIAAWRVTYTPGRWLVLSGPTSLVVMMPAPARLSGLVGELWADVVEARSIDELTRKLASFGFSAMPSLGVLFWDDSGLHSLVRGRVALVDVETGEKVSDGENIVTWTETSFGHDRHLRITMEPTEGDEKLLLPLVVGAVCASAIDVNTSDEARVQFAGPDHVGVLPQVNSLHAKAPAPPPRVGAAMAPPGVVLEMPGAAQAIGGVEADVAGPRVGALDASAEPDIEQAGSDESEHPAPDPDDNELGHDALEAAPAGAPTPHPELEHGEARADQTGDVTGGNAPEPASDQTILGGPSDPPYGPPPGTPPVGQPSAVAALPGMPPGVAGIPMVTGPGPDPVRPDGPPAAQSWQPEAPSPAPLRAAHDDHDGETEFTTDLAASHKPRAENRADDSLVLAAVCAAGHPNPPGSRRCRLCSAPVDASNPRLVARPVIASVRTNAGEAVQLNRPVIVGRAPDTRGEADATLLRVPSPSTDISRSHLRLSSQDWNIEVTDLNSTNGTILHAPGEPPVRLSGGESVQVGLGTVLDLGDGVKLRIEPPLT